MKLNYIKRFTAFITVFCISISLFSQQANTVYYMEGVTERSDYNPAFQSPYKFYIDLPVLPNFKFGIGNNSLSTHDIIFNKKINGVDSTISFLHPAATGKERGNFFKALHNTTRTYSEFSLNLLGFGFSDGQNYYTFNMAYKQNGALYLPKGLFDVMLNGTGENNNLVDLSKLGIDNNMYIETGIGFSRQFDDKLTAGLKVKYLMGLINLSSDIKSLNLQTGRDKWGLDAEGKIRASLPSCVDTRVYIRPDGTIDLSKIGDAFPDDPEFGDIVNTDYMRNSGFAIDLGAAYKIMPNLEVSAAITDFGFIRWKNNPSTFAFNKDWSFEGFKYAVEEENGMDQWTDELSDDFNNIIVDGGTGSSYTTWLHTRFNAGAEYGLLNNKIGIGLLSSTLFTNKTNFTDLTASVNFRPSRFIQPTVSYSILNNKFHTLGAGIQAKLGWWSTFLAIDHIPVGNNAFTQDYFPQYMKKTTIQAGMILAFGDRRKNMKDTDGDGILDRKDKCPETPAGYLVDKYGCTVDTDGDGIADNVDKCPNTPEGVQVDAEGCPVDTDGDGVADWLDLCPDTPENVQVDASGCPVDTDGDGVADWLDKCPDTPENVQVDASGCPVDTDGDGVADYLDLSPDTPAGVQVDASGCPVDTDGDGIPDHLDRCPKLPGIPANNGCPEIKEEVKTLFKKALNGIQFESGKAVIKKTSYPILDDIVKVMAENPDYNLTVSGHTDNVGKPDKNEVLSENRAQSVKDYLVQHGIEDKRIIPLGFGDSRPVEDNKTPSGRAKNRRVDFEVSFEVVSTQSTTIK